MRTHNDVIHLDQVVSYRPTQAGVWYTDTTSSRIFIPIQVLVRLYEGARADFLKENDNWEELCNEIFRREP